MQQGRARRSRACPLHKGIGPFPSPTQSSCRARGTRVPRPWFDRSAPATRTFRGRGPMAGCFPETAEWLLETPKHLLKTSKCLPQSFSPYPQNPRSKKSVAPKYKKPDETDARQPEKPPSVLSVKSAVRETPIRPIRKIAVGETPIRPIRKIRSQRNPHPSYP